MQCHEQFIPPPQTLCGVSSDLEDAEALLKETSFFILSFMFLSEFVIRQVQTNIYYFLKFCVICFCFQKNVVYIFPAISGWGNQTVWSTRPKLVA